MRPISHRPCVLAAKLNGVPSTLTSRSLAEMLTSMRFMGVRSARYRQNSASTRKLLRNPTVPMKPRHTATTRCPLWLRVGVASEPDACAYASLTAVPSPGQCAQLRLTLQTIITGWMERAKAALAVGSRSCTFNPSGEVRSGVEAHARRLLAES